MVILINFFFFIRSGLTVGCEFVMFSLSDLIMLISKLYLMGSLKPFQV